MGRRAGPPAHQSAGTGLAIPALMSGSQTIAGKKRCPIRAILMPEDAIVAPHFGGLSSSSRWPCWASSPTATMASAPCRRPRRRPPATEPPVKVARARLAGPAIRLEDEGPCRRRFRLEANPRFDGSEPAARARCYGVPPSRCPAPTAFPSERLRDRSARNCITASLHRPICTARISSASFFVRTAAMWTWSSSKVERTSSAEATNMLPATSVAVGSMVVPFFPGILISKASPVSGSGATFDALGPWDPNCFRVGFAPSSEADCAANRCSRLAASRASATLIALMARSNSSGPSARALSSPIFRRIVLINRNCRFGGPKPLGGANQTCSPRLYTLEATSREPLGEFDRFIACEHRRPH